MEQTHVWCNNCEEIQPAKLDVMSGTDRSGEFIKPTDLLCSKCFWIAATLYSKAGA